MQGETNIGRWYAVKVFFNKVFQMEDMLEAMGLETYLPVYKLQLKGQAHSAAARKLAATEPYHRQDPRYMQIGPVIYERKPLVTSLIFVKADKEQIKAVDARLRQDAEFGKILGFVYKTPDWKEFAAIPPSQMESFMLVTGSGENGLTFFADDDITRFAGGDRVRVKEGPLKGAEGYIKRIRKDRRLLVCIEGVIAVATSYIPPQMLEKVENA